MATGSTDGDTTHCGADNPVLQLPGGERQKQPGRSGDSVEAAGADTGVEDERLLRSSLIAAQLMGLAFMRFVWKIEPLASMDDDIVAAIAPTIQRYLDGDIHPAA